MRALVEFSSEFTTPQIISKGRIIPASEFETTRRVARSGSQIVGSAGKDLVEFRMVTPWSSKP